MAAPIIIWILFGVNNWFFNRHQLMKETPPYWRHEWTAEKIKTKRTKKLKLEI